jgi:hypothetical protein
MNWSSLSSAVSSGSPLVYEVAAIVLAVAAIAITHFLSTLSTNKILAKFPMQGKEIGGFNKRRQYFFLHARDLFMTGTQKVGHRQHHENRLLGSHLLTIAQFRDTIWRCTSADGMVEAASFYRRAEGS